MVVSKGGSVPQKPYDSDYHLTVRQAPTAEDMLEVLRRVTPMSYHVPILEDPRGSVALYRQMAEQAALAASRAHVSQQASFFLPWPTQTHPPAASLQRATFELTLTRTRDLQFGRIIEIAALDMIGDQGRTYTNAERVEWKPFDGTTTKTITMVSENPGYVGNLDHLADPITGLLTDPETGGPALSVLDLAVQGGRTNTDASIVQPVGGQSQIKDSGLPDQFLATDVGLYVEIIAAATPANVGRVIKIVNFSSATLEDPPSSGRLPHSITVDDGPQRQQIKSAQADDGGVFTDETAEAQDQVANDMTLLPTTAVVGDAYYFGHGFAFAYLELTISTSGDGDWALIWEYWNGASWVALVSAQDGTDGFRSPGINNVNFDTPAGWATTTVNGVVAFYIRARVSAVTTTTTAPRGTIASMFVTDQLTAEVGDVEWQIVDWLDLGFSIVEMETPSGGTDDMLRLLGEERGVFQTSAETDDQFRQRAARLADSVSPNAINRAINRELAEFGLRGLAIDVSNGYDGFFLDLDACDYYEPGDPAGAPDSPYKQLLSHQEAYGWFFVFVPVLTNSTDFGFGWDDSAEIVIGGTQIAPAWDVGFYDGFVESADAIYQSIWSAVDQLRAGGIGFTMIRDDTFNEDPCVP